jgi:hypothetical protein
MDTRFHKEGLGEEHEDNNDLKWFFPPYKSNNPVWHSEGVLSGRRHRSGATTSAWFEMPARKGENEQEPNMCTMLKNGLMYCIPAAIAMSLGAYLMKGGGRTRRNKNRKNRSRRSRRS